jgi:ribosomal protein L32
MRKRTPLSQSEEIFVIAPEQSSENLKCYGQRIQYEGLFLVPESVCKTCECYDRVHHVCDLAPQPSEKEEEIRKQGRLSFSKPKGTLRMNKGSGQGWHYRKM